MKVIEANFTKNKKEMTGCVPISLFKILAFMMTLLNPIQKDNSSLNPCTKMMRRSKLMIMPFKRYGVEGRVPDT